MLKRFEENEFVIADYNGKPPFSSFLPGICGADGVPLWCCYVNRGQAIASFGSDGREGAIMEFSPAVEAYEDTARKGFRTFYRVGGRLHEPFAPSGAALCAQTMRIAQNRVSLAETGAPCGLDTRVDCFLLPHRGLGALVRRVMVTNASPETLEVELLDGMARVLPFGVRNGEFREMGNLLRSFFQARVAEGGAALFSLRASTENDARVKEITRAHFCCAAMEGRALPLVLDAGVVFGQDTGYGTPKEFAAYGAPAPGAGQRMWNGVPCALAVAGFSLAPGESRVIYFASGVTSGEAELSRYAPLLCSPDWIDGALAQADSLTRELTAPMDTRTALPELGPYLRQCWLDNVMRGGQPFLLGDQLLHLYSRRHGDLERDYNKFAVPAAHYSQGDGNFRDVCQNRRSDVLFFPQVGNREIVRFAELLQLDGYNPLELLPSHWQLPPENDGAFFDLWGKYLPDVPPREIAASLHGGLAPSDLWRLLDAAGAELSRETELRFFTQLPALCRELPRAAFGDGCWIDHWTYVPELIDGYLKVFPRLEGEMVFRTPLRFFAAQSRVRPLREKLRAGENGARQYDAVETRQSCDASPWERDERGGSLKCSLFAKLLLLCTLKCATLDPFQRGLEMEAGKPGWNDALNGLPGLFGSSVSECVDLSLLVRRLSRWAEGADYILLPGAVWQLALALSGAAGELEQGRLDRFAFWRRSLTLRESWRERAYAGLSSADWEETALPAEVVGELLGCLDRLLADGLSRVRGEGAPPPTYYAHTPEFAGESMDFDSLCGFRARPLPVFLEGPAKLLRLETGAAARALYKELRESPLYDERLRMYRTCASLEGESLELGRIRAFTPGWFERESIFPHAEFKLLLALLRAELYEEFYSELRLLLPPFMNPDGYGRSILENSSFIASSANPDPALWGRGYIARLSGATAEVISMWVEMFLGGELFHLRCGELAFTLEPHLPGWMFDENGEVSFSYLGCRFCYRNPQRRHTWDGCAVTSMTVDGTALPGNTLPPKQAQLLRDGKLRAVTALLDGAPKISG